MAVRFNKNHTVHIYVHGVEKIESAGISSYKQAYSLIVEMLHRAKAIGLHRYTIEQAGKKVEGEVNIQQVNK